MAKKKLRRSCNATPNALWCGPTAAALIAGVTYERALAEFKRVRGGGAVKGVGIGEMFRVLATLGVHTRREQRYPYKEDRPTLARWLRERKGEFRTGWVLVNVTGHFMVVKGRKVWDNHHTEGVFLRSCHCRRSRVVRTLLVDKGLALAAARKEWASIMSG